MTTRIDQVQNPELARLRETRDGTASWNLWGPYLSERQWGTVREDYSADGDCWNYLPHDHARSRAYRWGEDGLLGICDDQCRLCFALALWNGRDPILKERLFGLTGPEGNHGEDVKELYYYLDSTPTHSYMKALYKYPQSEFPYSNLVSENRSRSRHEPEFELLDSGAFEQDKYFDVQIEYAKAAAEDILIRITVSNRGAEAAQCHLLPTLWCRNTWSWGRLEDGAETKPSISLGRDGALVVEQDSLGPYRLEIMGDARSHKPIPLFTENETNTERLYGTPNASSYVKDAFHKCVIDNDRGAVNPAQTGTKAALWYTLHIAPGASAVVRLRLRRDNSGQQVASASAFDSIVSQRMSDADEFFSSLSSGACAGEHDRIARQAFAGLLWSKQFYHYWIPEWLEGDPAQPAPPDSRTHGRNSDWSHLNNRDIISMPDKWEYPWYAAWDLAFHAIPLARIDPDFAKEQLVLFLREWYMHPSGQIPAYEFALGDVNPPVHAWAAWRVYKMTGPRGSRDRVFLSRVFQKLLLNFTWWVNRKDPRGRNLFAGGFLGLDNIGVFDRSQPLPTGGHLEQADGTAWMAFYCGTMLSMALELANGDPAYEDMATKFFEHYISIIDAMNTLGGTGLWDEQDGFYYDMLHTSGTQTPLKVRSMVGLIPLIACEVLEAEKINKLPDFKRRMEWFIKNRAALSCHVLTNDANKCEGSCEHYLLAVPGRERLVSMLRYMLDENEFLSPYGIRSVSAIHREHPYIFHVGGSEHRVDYVPGESTTGLFGGNSNWRGPIWFPLNYLIVEALERYHHFYGDELKVECPTGSGNMMTLREVAANLRERLIRPFVPDESGQRPCHGDEMRYAADPHFRDLVLFHEYFHGDLGKGLGASHQTGWTALVAELIRDHNASHRSSHVISPKPVSRRRQTLHAG